MEKVVNHNKEAKKTKQVSKLCNSRGPISPTSSPNSYFNTFFKSLFLDDESHTSNLDVF